MSIFASREFEEWKRDDRRRRNIANAEKRNANTYGTSVAPPYSGYGNYRKYFPEYKGGKIVEGKYGSYKKSDVIDYARESDYSIRSNASASNIQNLLDIPGFEISLKKWINDL